MDSDRFDDALRRMTRALSRRGLTLGMVGAGLNVALSDLFGWEETEAATKKCKKKKVVPTIPPSPPPPLPPPPPPPPPPHIVCDADKEACNGACVPRCPAPATLNPVTCQCCLPANVPCGPEPPIAPCCFELPIACFFNVCVGATPGSPCQFSGQCQPGVDCVGGFCTP